MTEALEDWWERRRLEEERKAAKRKARSGAGMSSSSNFVESREVKVKDQPCRVCALKGFRNFQSIEAHHIVHRGRIGGKHPRVHDQDNMMPVCHRHHQDHHNTGHRRIPMAALTESERKFLVRLGGEAWSERWYPA